MPNRLKKIIFILFSFFLCLTVFVGGIYIAGTILQKKYRLMSSVCPFMPVLVYDETLGWIGAKNHTFVTLFSTKGDAITYSFNSDGYRDDDWDTKIALAAATNAKRVLVLGDSEIFGMRSLQNKIFTAQAQKYADTQKIKVSFFNAGIVGYGFSHYRRQIDCLIGRIKPDEVWLMVNSNDWGDSAIPYDHRYPARVYKPFYDAGGHLISGRKIHRRPSLVLEQEFRIRPNRFTLVADHLSYIFEDINYIMKGIPTRWTSPRPIHSYEDLIFDERTNRKFPSLNIRVGHIINDIRVILKEKKITFRIIPINSRAQKALSRTKIASSIEVVELPFQLDSLISSPWLHNLDELHQNYLWGLLLSRYLINRIYVGEKVPDSPSFIRLIQGELTTSIDFSNTSALRNMYGWDWDLAKRPFRPKSGKTAHFGLANPFGANALVNLVLQSGKGVERIKAAVNALCPLKADKMLLECLDYSEIGILFFRFTGEGLISVEVSRGHL